MESGFPFAARPPGAYPPDMPNATKHLEIPPPGGGRLDRVVQQLTGLSRSGVFGLFDHGCVHLNGAPCREAGQEARAGDVLDVTWDPHRRYHPIPEAWSDGSFHVVHEDKHLIVVNKMPGILTVPTERGGPERTLIESVGRYLAHGGNPRPVEVVHRLDRETSGLLVLAKSREVALGLIDQFKERKPEREYLAIVAGVVAEEQGRFESHLATDDWLKRFSTDDPEEGEFAATNWRVERRLPGVTVVRVNLETGRRNQIRVHFAEAGHPVIGDPRYEAKRARHRAWSHKRIALHAAVLGFRHPVTGAALRFEAPAPKAFTEFYQAVVRGGGKPSGRGRRPSGQPLPRARSRRSSGRS